MLSRIRPMDKRGELIWSAEDLVRQYERDHPTDQLLLEESQVVEIVHIPQTNIQVVVPSGPGGTKQLKTNDVTKIV